MSNKELLDALDLLKPYSNTVIERDEHGYTVQIGSVLRKRPELDDAIRATVSAIEPRSIDDLMLDEFDVSSHFYMSALEACSSEWVISKVNGRYTVTSEYGIQASGSSIKEAACLAMLRSRGHYI